MKKRVVTAVLLLLTIMLAMPSYMAFASEERTDGNLAITVVVPTPEEQQNEQIVQVTQSPIISHVYPVHVWESRENGRREIIRVYELRDNESPAQIPRDTFKRDGFRFELAEIVRREIPAHSVIDHVETIELSTQTNDLESIIRLLSPTLEYLRDDGYFGVLALDISSIQIVSQGTTSSNFTATRTREFPHLSNADTSLVPRTITENGRIYNLTNVEWRNQTTTPIDYRQVATTFTAVATYSRVGTRTATIGYTTTATYRGQISRIAVGRTEFTAHFIGIPIVMPILTATGQSSDDTDSIGDGNSDDGSNGNNGNNGSGYDATNGTANATPAPEPIPPVIENVTVEHVHIGGIVIEKEVIPEPEQVSTADYETVADSVGYEDNENSSFPFGHVLIGLLFVGGLVLAYFVGKKGKAMLGAMKKVACVLLACGFLFGAMQTAYAAELPPYGFGARSSGNADTVHVDTRGNGEVEHTHHTNPNNNSSNTGNAVHFAPNQQHGGNAIHFAPNRASPSPMTVTPEGYIYGETIGVLTVERLGRRVNVIAGATMSAMDFGAGHFSFTGLNSGNTALIGHNRGRSNGFFDFVRHLQEGDIITLEAGGITRRYAVTTMFTICYSDFSPLAQFNDQRLSLITCVEYQRTQRRVAVAMLIE